MSKFLFFWGGPFSQWYKSNFSENGITFNCAEQYMMYSKAKMFNDEFAMKKILESSNPKKQKELGRTVTDYDDKIWNEHKIQIVTQGNYLKFSQNLHLKEILVKTKDKIIVEASPYDRIWGIGLGTDDKKILDPKNWRGTNWLGEAIMKVRETIKNGK
jgi:ribA/ribD-fused uncharacterized protein